MSDTNQPKFPTLYLFRHGATDWAVSGQHTGRTDIPLNDKGRAQALLLKDVVDRIQFAAVLTSPLSRAVETAKLAGLGERAQVCQDLAELNYGEYEGLTSAQIKEKVPDWTVWTHPCPGGEGLDQAAARASSVIQSVSKETGNVAIFSHGHMLRILAVTWLGLPATQGKHLMLDTSTLSVLSHEHGTPAIKVWNAPVNLIAEAPTLSRS